MVRSALEAFLALWVTACAPSEHVFAVSALLRLVISDHALSALSALHVLPRLHREHGVVSYFYRQGISWVVGLLASKAAGNHLLASLATVSALGVHEQIALAEASFLVFKPVVFIPANGAFSF